MSCYHPIAAFKDYENFRYDPDLKRNVYRYQLNGSFDPMYVDMYPAGDVIKVPCGKCLGCRLDYSRSWADRMFLEFLSSGKKAIFCTLTYNDKNISYGSDPDSGEVTAYSLCKRDAQLFMKRLRKAFTGRSVRFYLCGEYGGKTRRPHYHAILFGLDLKEDFPDFKPLGCNELGNMYFTSPKFEDIWSNGFVYLSNVSYKTCAYVARYVMKKAYNYDAPFGCEPEFATMSRNPGLASAYFNEHGSCVYNDHIFFNDGSSSYKISVPKFFMKKLQLIDPEVYDTLISERRKFSHDRDLLKLQQTDLSFCDVLSLDEEKKFNKTQILFKLREEV